VSVVAHVIRQFEAADEVVTLEKIITLPSIPTLGTTLDLRAHGVERPLTVIGLLLLTETEEPGITQPTIDLILSFEPFAGAQLARERGWRDCEQA
jgi:hypothetical protein